MTNTMFPRSDESVTKKGFKASYAFGMDITLSSLPVDDINRKKYRK